MATPQSTSITRSDLTSSTIPEDAYITNVQHLASYNWLDAIKPTIAVPGSPPAWTTINHPKQVRKDHGLIFIAQNAARHPDAPLEPLFRAIDVEKPDFNTRDTDIISDRNNFRKLLSFVDPGTKYGGLEPFTINVEVVRDTAIFCRDETQVIRFVGPDDFIGFGHEFEKAYTTSSMPDSTGHHRIISYRFHDLNMVIRHETDAYLKPMVDENADDVLDMMNSLSIAKPEALKRDNFSVQGSKLMIKKIGNEIPLSSTLEIKTRAQHRPLPLEEVAAQLWMSQTPNLVRALHDKGTFFVPVVENTTMAIQSWEDKNQASLKLLAVLMRKIVEAAKKYGQAVIKYHDEEDKLVISKREAKNMLPDDVYQRWEKVDSSVSTG